MQTLSSPVPEFGEDAFWEWMGKQMSALDVPSVEAVKVVGDWMASELQAAIDMEMTKSIAKMVGYSTLPQNTQDSIDAMVAAVQP